MVQLSSIVLSEHVEAVHLAAYLTLLQRQGKIHLFSHIPNETFTTQWSVKIRNKQEGVKTGVPDYVVVTNSHVLFIELKRTKGSQTSADQKEWLEKLKGKTTDTFLALGFAAAKEFIDQHLTNDKLVE